jgi:hypothetical protein
MEEKGFEGLLHHLKGLIKAGTVKCQFQFLVDDSKLYIEPRGRRKSGVRYGIERSPGDEEDNEPGLAEMLLEKFLGDEIKMKKPRRRIKPKRMLRPIK